MLRFILFCICLSLLYAGFIIIEQYDVKTIITAGNYYVSTTLFTLTIIFILAVFITLVVLKIAFLIFELPFLIRKRLYTKKLQKITSSLLSAATQTIINNNKTAKKIIEKIQTDVKPEYQEQCRLILAETEEDFDQKIQYFRGLIISRDYGYYATKRLAQLFYDTQSYDQAENYATRAFYLNEFDIEILEILLHCYARLKLWKKFTFVISKIAKIDENAITRISKEISQYYFFAAKSILEQGNDLEALNYLESAIEFQPSYIEALDLYMTLNNNLNRTSNNAELLKTAFTANPSFEIAQMYIRSSNLMNLRIYEDLAELVTPKDNVPLFLSIAAVLSLTEQITSLKEQKLLPVYI